MHIQRLFSETDFENYEFEPPKKKQKLNSQFSQIPDALWAVIFSNLDFQQQAVCSLVARRFNFIVNRGHLWKLVKDIFFSAQGKVQSDARVFLPSLFHFSQYELKKLETAVKKGSKGQIDNLISFIGLLITKYMRSQSARLAFALIERFPCDFALLKTLSQDPEIQLDNRKQLSMIVERIESFYKSSILSLEACETITKYQLVHVRLPNNNYYWSLVDLARAVMKQLPQLPSDPHLTLSIIRALFSCLKWEEQIKGAFIRPYFIDNITSKIPFDLWRNREFTLGFFKVAQQSSLFDYQYNETNDEVYRHDNDVVKQIILLYQNDPEVLAQIDDSDEELLDFFRFEGSGFTFDDKGNPIDIPQSCKKDREFMIKLAVDWGDGAYLDLADSSFKQDPSFQREVVARRSDLFDIHPRTDGFFHLLDPRHFPERVNSAKRVNDSSDYLFDLIEHDPKLLGYLSIPPHALLIDRKIALYYFNSQKHEHLPAYYRKDDLEFIINLIIENPAEFGLLMRKLEKKEVTMEQVREITLKAIEKNPYIFSKFIEYCQSEITPEFCMLALQRNKEVKAYFLPKHAMLNLA